MRARLEYLHKAATYLHNTPISDPGLTVPQIIEQRGLSERQPDAVNGNLKAITASLPRQYVSHMRGVSLKSQLRLPIDVKRSFCKRCDLLLVPGINCAHEIRNESKGRKKPWADVLVIRCNACETEKRFPQTQKRSKKLAERRKEMKQEEDEKATQS